MKNVTKDNCLATKNPRLAKEWHSTKNNYLTPDDVTYSSGKKIWWICGKGHEWLAKISNRNNGSSCPYCSGRKVNKDNCLAVTHPKLAEEWFSKKNGKVTPYDITYGSAMLAWWMCKKGHKWSARISVRSQGVGCPYCSGHRVCKDNCLTTLREDLAKQWHPTKNVKLNPSDVTVRSGIVAWWKCNKGHEWKASVDSRSRKNCKNGCPFCSHHRVSIDISLQVVNPNLSKEWDHTKNGKLKPSDVTPHSHVKVWWKCAKGHSWLAPVYSRSHAGCPFCKGVNLKCGAHCASLVEAYFYLKYKNKKKKFLHNKIYGKKLGKRRYDFYFPDLNKYVEVTSYDDRHVSSKKYNRNILKKKRYVENVLGAKFEFIRLFLTPKQIDFVRNNMA